jgi:hypothetical protein
MPPQEIAVHGFQQHLKAQPPPVQFDHGMGNARRRHARLAKKVLRNPLDPPRPAEFELASPPWQSTLASDWDMRRWIPIVLLRWLGSSRLGWGHGLDRCAGQHPDLRGAACWPQMAPRTRIGDSPVHAAGKGSESVPSAPSVVNSMDRVRKEHRPRWMRADRLLGEDRIREDTARGREEPLAPLRRGGGLGGRGVQAAEAGPHGRPTGRTPRRGRRPRERHRAGGVDDCRGTATIGVGRDRPGHSPGQLALGARRRQETIMHEACRQPGNDCMNNEPRRTKPWLTPTFG